MSESSGRTGKAFLVFVYHTGNDYSFHRLYIGITKVTIRPVTVGVGYKAVFAGSETVKNALEQYGYTMWINEDNKLTGAKSAADFVSLEEVPANIL